MKIQQPTQEDLNVFKEWKKADRIESLTCRPVVDGKRIAPSGETTTYSFFIEGVDKPAGKFSYFDVNSRNRSCEFGYTINPCFRNKGVGAQMLACCINYLFNNMDFNKLYCQTASFNVASVKLLEKLGFNRDGILRRHHELDGELFDDYIYSVLKSEWTAGKYFNS